MIRRICGTGGVAWRLLADPLAGDGKVVEVQIHAYPMPAELLSDGNGGAAANEGVQNCSGYGGGCTLAGGLPSYGLGCLAEYSPPR